MIHLFLSKKNTTYQQMIERNGDIVLKNCKSAKATFERNSIWYVEIEFPKSELLGMKISEESVFKVDLNFEKAQLFRIVYFKENRISDTYVCYATHIFFDSQKEIFVFDDRTVNSTWDGAIKTANDIIEKSKSKYPYHVYGDRWYEDYKNIKPEDGREVHIHNAYKTDLCVDVPSANEDIATQLQMFKANNSPAQTFVLKNFRMKLMEFMKSGLLCRYAHADGYVLRIMKTKIILKSKHIGLEIIHRIQICIGKIIGDLSICQKLMDIKSLDLPIKTTIGGQAVMEAV